MPRTYKYQRRGHVSARARARKAAATKRARYALIARRRALYRPRPTLAGRPKNNLVKMRYVDTITMNAGAGATLKYYFRANSIFDPDASGVGHQPMSHDQWSVFYNHYRVLGARIIVKFSGAEAGGPMVCGVFLNDDATAPTTYSEIMEQGRGKNRIMNDTGGPGQGTVTLKYSAKKFHSAANIKDRDDLKATFGNNPTEQAYFTLWVASMETSTDPGNVLALVTIDYIVALEEPKELPQS